MNMSILLGSYLLNYLREKSLNDEGRIRAGSILDPDFCKAAKLYLLCRLVELAEKHDEEVEESESWF